MTISYSGSLMALASGARGSSSFDWHTALPHGHSILSPSILAMSSSRQVFVMSQEMSSPAGSRVAMMSQILALQAFRVTFSAFSSGVSSGCFSAGAVAPGGDTVGLVSSAAEIARLSPRSAARKT